MSILGQQRIKLSRACALLALTCAAGVVLSAAASAAQTPPVDNPTNASRFPNALNITPESIVNQVTSNPAQAAADIASVANVDLGQAANIATNLRNVLQSGQMSPQTIQAAMTLVDQLSQGKISGAMGEALSQIPGMGNLNADAIQGLLSGNSPLASLLSGGLGTPQAQAQAINSALSAAGILGGANIQQQITNAIANGATQLLSSFLPQQLAGPLGSFLGGLLGAGGINVNFSNTSGGSGSGGSDPDPGGAGCPCKPYIEEHHKNIRAHMTNKRKEHEVWLTTDFFTDNVLPAMMLMTNQLSTVAMQQVHIIGTFLDAKHQLETQRLLQQMTAVAHKDYQPSEGMCSIGTGIRSMAASQRASELAHEAVAARSMQRQLLQGGGSSRGGERVDKRSRLDQFINKFCDKNDNGNQLDQLCKNSSSKAEQKNMDIDYAAAVENKLTLELDFYKASPAATPADPSIDEENIFALSNNLFAHDVLPIIDPEDLRAQDGTDPGFDAERYLLDMRALAAKRSVAQNSFAAMTGMRAAGDPENQPYLYKLMEEIGIPPDDIKTAIGEHPSHFAQMELWTKIAYQNPNFYTDLYDTPVNIERKEAALQAISLMQDRDIYESLIRSEAIMSVLLEMMIQEEESVLHPLLEELARQGQQSR